MVDYKEMKRRHEVIKELGKKYRSEMTLLSAIVVESEKVSTFDDYVKWSDELSDEEFAMNYATAMYVEALILEYEAVLAGNMKYEEIARQTFGQIIVYSEVEDKMNYWYKCLSERAERA